MARVALVAVLLMVTMVLILRVCMIPVPLTVVITRVFASAVGETTALPLANSEVAAADVVTSTFTKPAECLPVCATEVCMPSGRDVAQ